MLKVWLACLIKKDHCSHSVPHMLYNFSLSMIPFMVFSSVIRTTLAWMYNFSWCLRSLLVSNAEICLYCYLQQCKNLYVACPKSITSHVNNLGEAGHPEEIQLRTILTNCWVILLTLSSKESLRRCRKCCFSSSFDKVLFVGLFVFVKYDHFFLLLPQPHFIFLKHFVCVTK